MITKIPKDIKMNLAEKDGKEFDNYIQLLSTPFLIFAIDNADFLTTSKKLRISELLTARQEGSYYYNPLDKLFYPRNKEIAIEQLKDGTISQIKFNIPVEYAGVYIDTAYIEIIRGLKTDENGDRVPNNNTKDLEVIINNKTLKGLTNARKALKDFDKARDLEVFEFEFIF